MKLAQESATKICASLCSRPCNCCEGALMHANRILSGDSLGAESAQAAAHEDLDEADRSALSSLARVCK